MLCAFLLMVLLGTIGYLPLTLVLTGGIDLLTVKPLAFLLGGLAVLMSLVSGAVLLRRLMAWLSVKDAKLALPPCSAGASGGLLAYLRKIRVTQRGRSPLLHWFAWCSAAGSCFRQSTLAA